jgi:hypothetical protein
LPNYTGRTSSTFLVRLAFQFSSFIDDTRRDDGFRCANHISGFSVMLVETKKIFYLKFSQLISQISIALPGGDNEC